MPRVLTPLQEREVTVWDPVVRVLHWGIAALVFTAFLFSHARHFHMAVGYAASGLAVLRIAWGVFGSRRARFTGFVRGPRAALQYLLALGRGQPPRYLGHNPAGAAMIVALLGLLCLAGFTGWLSQTNAYFGVLWVEDLHAFAGNSLVFLAVVHIAGVLASSAAHGESLVRAMVTGRKPIVSARGELPVELEDEGGPSTLSGRGVD